MAAEIRPFGKDAPRVWTIPPGTDFLGSLARVLADTFRLRERADALADAIIYLPNRRSARALTLALFDTLGGAGTLLPPDIRTLGDLDSDEPPPVPEAALAGLAPALSPAAQLGVLAAPCRPLRRSLRRGNCRDCWSRPRWARDRSTGRNWPGW
jgi:ATP-dependent helicase/nuclease subunit B